METCSLISSSPQETMQIGKHLASYLSEGDYIPLIGDLGTGKTCLVRGIVQKFLGCDENPVHSPSFTLINKYIGKKVIYHIDLFRLNHPSELIDIGFEDILKQHAIFLIEWPDLALPLLPSISLKITFSWSFTTLNTREICFSTKCKRFSILLKELAGAHFRD